MANAVIYRPKSLVLGIGCDKGTASELIDRGMLSVLARSHLSLKSVKALATIDKKKNEPGILALAERFGWSLEIYTAEELDGVPGIENPSETVMRYDSQLVRAAYTTTGDVLVGIGFAMLLAAMYALSGKSGLGQGLLWGLAGFATIHLGPALVVPPSIPALELAPLSVR